MNISSDSGKRTITLGERGQWLATSAFEQFSVISKGHIPISSDSPRQRHLPKLVLSQFQPTPNSHQRTRNWKLDTPHLILVGGGGWEGGTYRSNKQGGSGLVEDDESKASTEMSHDMVWRVRRPVTQCLIRFYHQNHLVCWLG